MKNKGFAFIILSLVMAGCASMTKYEEKNKTEGGIKVALSQDQAVHINDKVYLLERKCVKTPKAPLCGFEKVGLLTVKEIYKDYILLVPDSDFIFKEGQYFKFAAHCEKNEARCRDL